MKTDLYFGIDLRVVVVVVAMRRYREMLTEKIVEKKRQKTMTTMKLRISPRLV